jgi:hypothetical protein
MIVKMGIKIDIDPVVEQVNGLDFDKSLAINYTDENILNGPYKTKLEFIGTKNKSLNMLEDIKEELDGIKNETIKTDLSKKAFIKEIKSGFGEKIKNNPDKVVVIKPSRMKRFGDFLSKIFDKI